MTVSNGPIRCLGRGSNPHVSESVKMGPCGPKFVHDHDGGVSYFVTQDSMGLFSTRCMDMSHVTSVQNENDPKCTILSLDHQTAFSLPPYVDTRKSISYHPK